MNIKKSTMLVVVLVGILAVVYTLASTYAVIINVKEEDGVNEIVNEISIRDLVTDDNGNYNRYYYNVKNELDITDIEATLLIESKPLNENLDIVLRSIVDYKLNNNIDAKLSNDELYNLIVDGVNRTGNLSEELKNKVINKSNTYKQDISDYVYGIAVEVVEDNV